MRGLFTEIRNAARSLSRAPTVALSAVLCLALGIGATTAISSAISRALLERPPFREPERLVAVHRITPNSGPLGTWPQSPANYLDLARSSQQVQNLSALWQWGGALVHLQSEAMQVSRVLVSGSLFPMLSLTNPRGRMIGPDDDRLESPLVVVVSDDFWRTRLGSDPGAIGRSLTVDGQPATIIGITPPDFRIPFGGGMFRGDLWMPIRFTPQQVAQRGSNFLQMVGRLAPGATVESADAEMKTLFNGLVATYPILNGENLRVAPLQRENTQAIRTPLLLIFGAVCMVLLIAATNVAALLLARGVQRRREMAVRSALGATRWAAMQPALAESALITAVGVVAGIALAIGGVRTIGSLAAARMPQLVGLSIDFRVIAFALLLALVVAVVCGAVPAWRGAIVDPQDALRGGRGGGAGREHQRALRTLVVTEIALSLMLLIGAGLVLKGFAGLLRNDPGFDTSRILTLRITTSATLYPNQTSVRQFLEPALAEIRAVPGVEAAAAITAMPYVVWGNNGGVRYEGQPKIDPSKRPIVEFRAITPGFFQVTEQRLVSGRMLLPSDDERPEAPIVAVVNQALVKRDFAGRDPVGQRFHLSDTTFATIVGVVSDIRNMGPVIPPQPEMYSTYRQGALGSSNFPVMIRVHSGDPIAVAAAVRAAIRRIDPSAAVGDLRSMPEVIGRSLGTPRFYFSLLGSFAVVAVVLAIAGLYGVLSYAVAQRTREIGIRSALGSPRAGVMRLVTMEGLRLVALGVALGFVGGFATTRLMKFMLYGVSPLDAVTWAAAAALMVAAAMVAVTIPAFRASRVSPMVAMQAE